MRPLVVDPAAVDPSLYQRLVQGAQVEALMADYLVQGEPYLAPNAMLLGREESRLLRRLTPIFARVFQRAGAIVASDSTLMEEWGFPWVAAELLAAEAPRMPIVGRFDYVCDEKVHWWLLEFNADTPSSVREANAADRVDHRLLPGAS